MVLFIFHSRVKIEVESMSGESLFECSIISNKMPNPKSIDTDSTLNVGHLQFEMWVSCVTVQEMLAK